jgi:hypothetical protein
LEIDCDSDCLPSAVLTAIDCADLEPWLYGWEIRALALPEQPAYTGSALTSGWHLLDVAAVLALPEPDWLVDGLVPRGGRLVSLSGLTNTGKTFLVLDLCLALATGSEWFGRTTAGPVDVLFLALEGPYDVRSRLAAWMQANGKASEHLARFHVLAPESLDLTNPADLTQLEDVIRRSRAQLVVIDTLSVALGDRDENSASDLRPVLGGLRSIVKRTASTVLLIQHTPWDGKRERGSNSIRSEMDATLHVEASDSPGIVYLTNPKQRSARRADPTAWRLLDVAGTSSAVVVQEALPGQESVESRVLDALDRADAGLTKTGLRGAVGGNTAAVDAAVQRLVESGDVVDRGNGRSHVYARV